MLRAVLETGGEGDEKERKKGGKVHDWPGAQDSSVRYTRYPTSNEIKPYYVHRYFQPSKKDACVT